MLCSPTLGKLAEALAKAQGEMKAPSKGKTMKIPGRGDYRYADLAEVIEARKVGAKYNLAITQGMEMRDGFLALTTLLMHSSGEWKGWECPIPAGLKPQELGSYLTYMRRYSECGAWGIAAEDDDDGKAAQEAEPTKPKEEEPAPVDADSAAIIDVAQAIGQHNGRDWLAIIRSASEFKGDNGDQVWFENPTEKGYAQNGDKVVRTTKPGARWKGGVRRKLEDELRKLDEALSPITDADVPF